MRIFVGCYTKKISEELLGKGEGIYCLDFDTSSGELKLIDVVPSLNPSYLTLSKNGNYLYAVEEIPMDESPKIKAFNINSEGNTPTLSLINKQELPGSFSCHLSLTNSQTHLVIASYMSGNVLVYPIDANGGILPFSQNIQHKGTGPNKIRQEAPHAHMIHPYGSNGIFVVDLGLDLAKYYKLEGSTGQMSESQESDISVQKGAGARHMAIHPDLDFAFVFSELSAEVFSYHIVGKRFELLEAVQTLPEDYTETPSGAAIRMHPSGKFLYVSNRSNNSITIFRFNKKSKKLLLAESQSSGGRTPREINIDPTGKWLLAANQDSNNIVVFSINQSNGLLIKKNVHSNINSASCIQFLEN